MRIQADLNAKKNYKRAFSLVEILISISIIGILLAATMPVITVRLNKNSGSGDITDCLWKKAANGTDIYYETTSDKFVGIGSNDVKTNLYLEKDGGILAKGTFGSGQVLQAATSDITGFIWYPKKAAFIVSQGWSDANIGNYSVALNGKASGNYSTAFGSGVASGDYSVAGGDSNTASEMYSTAAMGYQNTSAGIASTVRSGTTNKAFSGSDYSTIGSGYYNITYKTHSFIGNGNNNTTNSQYSTLANGSNHSISGNYSTISNGSNNSASGPYNWIGGRYMRLSGTGNMLFGYNGSAVTLNDNFATIFYGKSKSTSNTSLYVYGKAYKTDGSTAWSISSDARLKEVLGEFKKGLSEISKLKVVNYKYKKNEKLGYTDKEPTKSGLIAQEVQKIFPEAVSKDENGYLKLDTTSINFAMINAIKELNNEDDEIQAEQEDMKQTLETLEKTYAVLAKQETNIFIKFWNWLKNLFMY